MKLHPVVLLFSLLIPLPTAAQEADPCVMAAKTQAELNECSTQRYRAVDVTLNRVYKEIVAALGPKPTGKLKEAQRAWIAFRDANCEAQAFDYANGRLYTKVYTDCLSTVTQTRIAELRRVYLGLQQEAAAAEIEEHRLLGTWRALEASYGVEISFGIDKGIHHYLSQLNGLPYEAGQWQLSGSHLSVIDNRGKVLHNYPRIQLDSGVLSLYEEDGSVQSFKKIAP